MALSHLWGPGQEMGPLPRLQAPCCPGAELICLKKVLHYHLTRGSSLLTPGSLSPQQKKNFSFFPSRVAVQSKLRIKFFPFYYYTVHFCLRPLMPKKQIQDVRCKDIVRCHDSFRGTQPTRRTKRRVFHMHMWTRRCSKPNGQGPMPSQAP